MKEELESLGLKSQGLGSELGDGRFEHPNKHVTIKELDEWPIDPEVKAVICGTDFNVNYSKLAVASLYLQRGAKLIATNPDLFDSTAGGNRTPANGAIVACLEATAKKTDGKGLICEKVVTGKPNPRIIDIIREDHDISKD